MIRQCKMVLPVIECQGFKQAGCDKKAEARGARKPPNRSQCAQQFRERQSTARLEAGDETFPPRADSVEQAQEARLDRRPKSSTFTRLIWHSN